MTKQHMASRLRDHHRQFLDYIHSLNDEEFLFRKDDKWTAGQQLDHILRSVRPLNMAFSLPPFLLRLLFGKANRPSRTYEGLVEKYKAKLAAGGRATGTYIPKKVGLKKRKLLANELTKAIERLCVLLDRYSEDQLDELLLPHPLLGKLTLREMLYFTMYHVTHHLGNTQRNLSS